jgi:hypothetical protein
MITLSSPTKIGLTNPNSAIEPALWQLGNHRLLCGDSTSSEDLQKLMDGDLADMAFTDPPYNVDYGNNAKDKMRGKDRRILNDNLGDNFYGLPEPPNKSSTISLLLLELRIARSTSSTGFIVGCRSFLTGLLKNQTSP